MQPTNLHSDPAGAGPPTVAAAAAVRSTAATRTAASFAPSSSSASSSSSSNVADAYDQQDVSGILPPSRRSSLSTRRSSAVDASLTSWGGQRPPPAHAGGGLYSSRAEHAAATSSRAAAAAVVAQEPFTLWRFPLPAGDDAPAAALHDTTRLHPFAEMAADEDVQDSRTHCGDGSDGNVALTSPSHPRELEAAYEATMSPHNASLSDAEVSAEVLPPPPALVSAPQPEDAIVRTSRTPAAAPAATAAAAGNGASHAIAHVHFASDVDVVEVASHASTSTSAAAMRAEGPRVATAMYDVDESDDSGEGVMSGVVHGSVPPERTAAPSSAAPSHTPSHRREDGTVNVVDVQTPLPVLLTPDELQMERLRAYDHAARQSPDGYHGDAMSVAVHVSDDDENGDAHASSAAARADVAVEGEMSHAQRGATAGVTRLDNPNDGVSTLDFLRDTAHTILPDAFTSMFATTTNFLKTKTDAVVSAVPRPLRRAMTRTGESIATAADVTGEMLSNVGGYAMLSVPDKVLSPELKHLIFVDAANVLKCSLNVNILVAPYIFRMAGLVGGVLLILSTQVVCCYYAEVYFRAKNELKAASHVIMYGDVPRLTFGRWYPTFQLWYDGIALVATVAYAALNMQALLPHMNIHGDAAKALSFIIPSLFCLPLAFMKYARSQPPMMTLASLLIFISLIMTFTVFPYGSVVAATIASIDGNVAVLHLFPLSAQEFFVALGVCVFVFTPLSRAVPVERTMQPRRYIKLLRVCVGISTLVYIAFGVCAIISYGSKTCSVLSTSFNHNNTPVEVAVMSLLFFAFLFYIPLHMFELGELCDRRMLGWRAIPRYGEVGPNLLRVLFLVGSALVAWCIPYYGLLIAFSGYLGYSVVAIVIPAALDYVCRARDGLLHGHTPRFLDYVVTFSGVALGVMTCVVGVVMTTYEVWLVVQPGYTTTC